MQWGKARRSEKDETNAVERNMLIEDVREAEREWRLAVLQFEDALGDDHVDYAIYCLEAAEKKLDMLLRKAKMNWNRIKPMGENGVAG
jgi:hypothetical protein